RNTTTGSSPTGARTAASRIIRVCGGCSRSRPSEDLERDHELVVVAITIRKTRRVPEGQHHWQAMHPVHLKVDLKADVVDGIAYSAVLEVRGQRGCKQRRTRPRHVEPRRADGLEAQRRQVPFEHAL